MSEMRKLDGDMKFHFSAKIASYCKTKIYQHFSFCELFGNQTVRIARVEAPNVTVFTRTYCLSFSRIITVVIPHHASVVFLFCW